MAKKKQSSVEKLKKAKGSDRRRQTRWIDKLSESAREEFVEIAVAWKNREFPQWRYFRHFSEDLQKNPNNALSDELAAALSQLCTKQIENYLKEFGDGEGQT